MDIHFKGIHKSLTDFEWIDVPMLSIITGTNGAGKTQLLETIYDTIIDNPNQKSGRVSITEASYGKGETLFLRSDWVLNNTSPMNLVTLQNEINSLYSQFVQGSHSLQHFPKLNYIMDEVAAKIGKPRNQNVSLIEFQENFPIDFLADDYQVTNQINKIFVDYNITRIDEIGKGTSSEEINKLIGPKPWDILNKIMEEASLPFIFNNPENTGVKLPFKLEITDSIRCKKIEFGDLSSGEKVLVSLVIFLYSSRERQNFPKFLLLDEPDAHLHPSMTKQFLDVISKVFVLENNIRVIMSTHSPSTIALAPEDAIFIVNKIGERVSNIDKDAALKILTSGVPSFSVNYENRRQVFVESQNDVLFYERIYQKLIGFLVPEVSLTFISSGESRTDKSGQKISNCGQVINITTILRNAGNKFVWGIIDWDTSNTESNYVKVLGNGQRYSIENYLLDPLLVVALLLREKFITKAEIGLGENETYLSLKTLPAQRLQLLCDFLINRVKVLIKLQEETQDNVVTLLNKIEIKIPIWYLHYPGHSLEEIIIKAFPKLNEIKRDKESALKLAIIDKVVDDLPDLLSSDFIDTFKKVQEI